MPDFPANSRKARETEPPEEINAVTSATVRRRRGLGRRFKETFIAGTGREAVSYAVEDVVVPTVRDMFVDAIKSGIDRLFYGDRSAGRPRPGRSALTNNVGHVNYAGMSTSQPSQGAPTRSVSKQARTTHSFDELVIPSRAEAREVIDRMYEIMSRNGVVTVAELYSLTGVRPEHTDVRWGWTSLRGAREVEVRRLGGYILDLPQPEDLR
jgi:hypothetical protein